MVKNKVKSNRPKSNNDTKTMKKKFGDHEQSLPVQLKLFFLEDDARYSHTIELYDSLPKFVTGKVTRISDVYLPSMEREFEFRGKSFRIIISPASIRDKKGTEKYFYPGKREEIIQDALRKLMVEGQGLFLDSAAGVAFTLYELRKELQTHGHTYNNDQIKESLKVLTKTTIELFDDQDKAELTFHPIENLGIKGEEDETQTFAKFSPLVTKSIQEKSFRMFNYDTVMSYKSTIARRLHKRMAHHYVHASIANNYHLKLTTLIRDFGLSDNNPYSSVIQNVEKALKEMRERNVILSGEVIKEHSAPGQGRKIIVDALIKVIPTAHFANEVKMANAVNKSIVS